jgi:hypothetical protein
VSAPPLKLVTPASTVAASPGERNAEGLTVAPVVTVAPVAASAVASAPAVPAARGAPGTSADQALQQLQSFGSRALAQSVYRLRRVGTAGLTGLALLVAAIVLFLANNLPQSSAVFALKAQVLRLAPVGKAVVAAPGGGTVLAALPQRDDAPTVVGKVFEQAEAAGVELSKGQYEFIPARDGVAARYRMTFPVRTSYPKLRDFMDRTLVALPAVAVEGLRVERKSVGDETVDAELKLSAYVRSEP